MTFKLGKCHCKYAGRCCACLAAASLLAIVNCTPAERQKDAETALKVLDKVCAARAAEVRIVGDGGAP